MNSSRQTQQKQLICGRQIAFFSAFLLPCAKLVEVPSLLAKYAKGDLLLPAILHFLLQAVLLFFLLYTASRSEKSIFERLQIHLGKWSAPLYVLYAVYFIFTAILLLLDMEKFTYAAFFDTAPTVFSFVFFFVFSSFLCMKGVKTLGRVADLSLFLFLIPFLALLAMSVTTADFSHLLPWFGTQFGHTMSAFTRTTPHFSDAVLLLPLVGNLHYKKGDGVKILGGYAAGAICTLLFLATFYGIYASIAAREHYAFAKIAEYFPALRVIGRFDLLFVYTLTIVLLFYTATPLLYATDLTCRIFHTEKRTVTVAILNAALLLFLLFFNRHYNTIYTLIGGKLSFVFYFIADMLPLFLLFLPKTPKKSERALCKKVK